MNLGSATDFYDVAKRFVLTHGYRDELCWQRSLKPDSFTESDLLREAAWVILCAGFRESNVRRSFDFISLAFCDWESATVICTHAEHCRAMALSRFRNDRKIDAIISTSSIVREIGFAAFKSDILNAPIATLQLLPFIGPITAFHLAKNLGIPTAKPDRHLQRLARYFGWSSVHGLCDYLAEFSGDSVQVVDLVLWRYCEQRYSKGELVS